MGMFGSICREYLWYFIKFSDNFNNNLWQTTEYGKYNFLNEDYCSTTIVFLIAIFVAKQHLIVDVYRNWRDNQILQFFILTYKIMSSTSHRHEYLSVPGNWHLTNPPSRKQFTTESPMDNRSNSRDSNNCGHASVVVSWPAWQFRRMSLLRGDRKSMPAKQRTRLHG